MRAFHSVDSLAVEKRKEEKSNHQSKTKDIRLKQEERKPDSQGFPLFPQTYSQEKRCFPVNEA